MSTIDARAACAALNVTPAELADVARAETARLLRAAADVVEADPLRDVNEAAGLFDQAENWITVAAASEALWGESSGESDGRERNEGVSPRSTDDSPAIGSATLTAGKQSSRTTGGQT